MARLITFVPFLLILLSNTFGYKISTDLDPDFDMLIELLKTLRSVNVQEEPAKICKDEDHQHPQIPSTETPVQQPEEAASPPPISENEECKDVSIKCVIKKLLNPEKLEESVKFFESVLKEATKIRDTAKDQVDQLIQAIEAE